jgi:hypothetical protein
VFGIEFDSCVRCGGKLKIIASIEEPGAPPSLMIHQMGVSEELTKRPAGTTQAHRKSS